MQIGRVAAAACLLSGIAADVEYKRLRVVNGCDSRALWIAHITGGTEGPDPQDVKIEPLAYHDFSTPDNLRASRFWPKMGCDASGGNCQIGDSGGPGESCVTMGTGGWQDYSRCAPPVDTKFEASFGQNGQPCNPETPGGIEMAGCDYVDISLVDGFTLPVKLEMSGGECKELTAASQTVDLQAVNPRTMDVGGCYSPCMRLLDTKWTNQTQHFAEALGISPYCCPTPPVDPDTCRNGPIRHTEYVKLVASKCSGAYSYSYDDSNGLLRCSSSTQYVLTFFCPAAIHPVSAASGSGGAGDARSKSFLYAP